MAVLVFIGGKMLATLVGVHIESGTSLMVVLGLLALSAAVSMIRPPKEA